MPARESLSLTIRDLRAQIAPHTDIDVIYQGDPARIIVTVICAGVASVHCASHAAHCVAIGNAG